MTSSAVPNVVTVLMNDSSRPRGGGAAGRRSRRPQVGLWRARRGVGGQLLVQRGERGVAARSTASRPSRSSRCARHSPRFAIRGARPSGWRLRRRTLTGGSSRCGATPSISGATRRSPRPGPSGGRRPAPGRRVARRARARARHAPGPSPARRGRAARRPARSRGEQQLVAVAQGHVELLGEVQHHLGAGPRPPGLDEAQVPRGDVGLERQVELAGRRRRHSLSSGPTPARAVARVITATLSALPRRP